MKILHDMQGTQCQSRHRGIGRYSLNLAKALAPKATDLHELCFMFNARLDEATDTVISTLQPYANDRHRLLVPSLAGVSAQGAGNEVRRLAAELTMRHAISQARPDVMWYSSMIEGYADDVVVPERPVQGIRTAATLYDLIPLHDPQAYLDHPRVKAWYEVKLKALSQCDMLLAISEWVRQDAIERLGLDPMRVVTIGGGVDPCFTRSPTQAALPAATSAAFGIGRPYVLYSGGFDARKNVARLIQAFAALPSSLRNTHQLVIVGSISTEQMTGLRRAMRQSHLADAAVTFTGFVGDDTLASLYAGCALFVFPSLMEGFGLPPLEAMACGAPVITSNAASLPEVVSDPDATFDPLRTHDIATMMAEALSVPARSAALREHGLRRAAMFSWEAVAARALAALETLATRTPRFPRHAVTPTGKPPLLCLHASPPPSWIDRLEDTHEVVSAHLPEDLSSVPTELASRLGKADRVLYLAGTKDAWRLSPWMREWPGTALLSDGPAEPMPGHALAMRYRAGGYVACTTAGTPVLNLLPDGCIGVFLESAASSRLVPPGVPCAVLPCSHQAEFAATHLEQWFEDSVAARESALLDELGPLAPALGMDELARTSHAVASLRPRARQWLVDVTQISRHDIGTGVQRVVRSILREWLHAPPSGIRIEPVAFIDGHYRYARRYAFDLVLGPGAPPLEDDFVQAWPGDTFVGLDWSVESLTAAEPLLREWHRLGVGMHFLVHDLLPISLPDAFHPFSRNQFTDWLCRVCGLADSLHCVSAATAGDLARWLEQSTLAYQFRQAPAVDHFRLGSETWTDLAATPLPAMLASAMAARRTLLMVGTLEPRKGHAQALDAMESLWAGGQDLNLLVIGHVGWMVEALVERLEKHAQKNRRLFWLADADDAKLEAAYRAATALLAPSWGEGYGLPLVEAAHRGLPVIARNLPVFREVMGDYPCYFDADRPDELAATIASWLQAPPIPGALAALPSWRQSAQLLANSILKADPADTSRAIGIKTVV